jgi:transcriptional regulator with XRE-family HTH domain
MTSKQPHPIDRLVGSRVRLIRTARGLSQSRLADDLGITFQQVQKYEKGTNRISASRLFDISRVLGVSVPELYVGADDDALGSTQQIGDALPSLLDHKIVRALSRIDDDQIKRKVLALIRTLAPETEDGDI